MDTHNRCGSFTSFATFDSSTYWMCLDCNKKTTLESYADTCQQGLCGCHSSYSSFRKMKCPLEGIASKCHQRMPAFYLTIKQEQSSDRRKYRHIVFLRFQSCKHHRTSSLCSFQAQTFNWTQCGKEGRKVLPADKVQYGFILLNFIV